MLATDWRKEKMTGKIFRSIFTVAVSILLACLVILIGVLYSYFSGVQESSLKTMLSLSASGVEKSGMAYFDSTDRSCRLTWIDQDGKVLFDSEKNADQMENHMEREEIRKAFSDGEGQSIRYSDTVMEKTMNRAIKLSDGTVLRASVSTVAIWALLLGMLQPICILFFFALVLSAIIAYSVSKRITEPLERIDLDRPLDGKVYEELTPLLRKIDAQNKRIDSQKKELADRRVRMEFAEESRREFTANVSHELKTPLQSVMGSAELIENQLVKYEDIPRFASGIRKEATRLLDLIDDIIHLSRLDENSVMEFSDVDIYSLCEEEIESLSSVTAKNNVSIQLLGEHTNISAVPQLMKEIIHNLIDNAVKYNKEGGKVTVRAFTSEDKHILSVSDTGIGISPEHREHIFERFYRVDKSHSKATGGTGLGLSIVKHAVAYQKGEISLNSELGVGTTITVSFRNLL